MGRYSTGSRTTKEALRIELSYLLKNGYIKKGCTISSSISWTNGSNIGIKTKYTNKEAFIKLDYIIIDNSTNEKKEISYKIDLVEVPSNLGKGKVLYFICPVSKKKCRILYKVYNSEIWKSRTAYQNRIYYKSQLYSKNNLFICKYWDFNSQLEEMYRKPFKRHYRGKKTRIMQRIERLEAKEKIYYSLRWSVIPKSVQNYLHKQNINFPDLYRLSMED